MTTQSSRLFTGWDRNSLFPGDTSHQELRKACTKAINWDALLEYASDHKNGTKCQVVPQSTMGSYHLVHLLRFEDGSQWIVKFQLNPSSLASAKELQSEIDTMSLIRSRTKLPVPEVFASDPQGQTSVGVPFVMMEYIPGVVAMDLDGGYEIHHGEIRADRKPIFYPAMASVQVSSHKRFQ
jgi:hypothetical protein